MRKIFKGIIKSISKTAGNVTEFLSFVQEVKPANGFDKNLTPPKVDYQSLEAWAAHPQKQTKVNFRPKNANYPITDKKVDIFFIHPTTYFGKDNWNADIHLAGPKELIDELVIPGEASVFEPYAKVYAPRYRQATFYSFWEGGDNAKQALSLAYEDVVNAFHYFLEHHNHGRPFILASHSQGTILGMRLLEEYIDNTSLYKKMIAAYLVGFRFPLEKFKGTFKNVIASSRPNDLHAVISWDTYEEGGKAFLRLDSSEYWYQNKEGEWYWEKRAKKTPLCVNPISWTQSLGKAYKAEHLGGVFVELEKSRIRPRDYWTPEAVGMNAITLSKVYPDLVEARCGTDGLLYITKPKPLQFRMFLLPGGNYHNYDYWLFYRNIQQNVELRIKTFFEKYSEEK